MRYKQARTEMLVQEVGAIYLLHNRAVMFLSPLSTVLVRSCAHLQIHICSFLRPVCVWVGMCAFTACVAQLAACSYSVGWYLLLGGTRLFINLEKSKRKYLLRNIMHVA